MKTQIKHIIVILVSLAALSLHSCDAVDGEGGKSMNAVYMETPNNSGILSMTVSNEKGGSAIVTPRLGNITNTPIKIRLTFDKKVIEDYNAKHNTDIQAVDVSDFIFVNKDGSEAEENVELVIDKGAYSSGIEVKINSINEEKYPFSKSFAIPLVITSASDYPLLEDSKTVIIKLNRMVITSVAKISNGGIKMTPKTPYSQMDEWTFQMSVIYSTLTRSNLTTAFINSGSGEFYTRIYHNKGIQVKNGRDGDDTWTQRPLEAGKWLNISYVYKNRSVSVYVNGELHKTFQTTPISLQSLAESGWTLGNGGYRDDYVREVRFWNRALSEAEINERLYLPQDPNSDGLEMYLPLTKESETEDVTGKWNVTPSETTRISYIENVIFPAEELKVTE